MFWFRKKIHDMPHIFVWYIYECIVMATDRFRTSSYSEPPVPRYEKYLNQNWLASRKVAVPVSHSSNVLVSQGSELKLPAWFNKYGTGTDPSDINPDCGLQLCGMVPYHFVTVFATVWHDSVSTTDMLVYYRLGVYF